MLILGGIFLIGIGIYVKMAPNDWGEDEWFRYDSQTRKSTLHPAIGGPLAIVVGVIFVIGGIVSGVQDANEAQAERSAQAANDELSQAFSPIMASLREHAEAQPGVLMTLTVGDRERAGLSEETVVYYGWCTVDSIGDNFYIIVLDWHGKDYQHGFPGTVWGACGGSPIDFDAFMGRSSRDWLEIRSGTFNYDAELEQTEIAPTTSFELTQLALTETACPTITPTADGN